MNRRKDGVQLQLGLFGQRMDRELGRDLRALQLSHCASVMQPSKWLRKTLLVPFSWDVTCENVSARYTHWIGQNVVNDLIQIMNELGLSLWLSDHLEDKFAATICIALLLNFYFIKCYDEWCILCVWSHGCVCLLSVSGLFCPLLICGMRSDITKKKKRGEKMTLWPPKCFLK